MVSSTSLSVFPPEIWSIISQWLQSVNFGKLLLTGNRLLAQKLVEGGVEDWRCEIGPSRIAKRAWPMLIREFRHLKSFSLVWNENYQLETEIGVSQFKYLPKGLKKIELDLAGQNPCLFLQWRDFTSHFAHLKTLKLSNVLLEQKIPDFIGIQALETLILDPARSVLEFVLLGLPTTLKTFEYYQRPSSDSDTLMQVSFHALPQLTRLKLDAWSFQSPPVTLNLEFIENGPILPNSLTSLHLSPTYGEIIKVCFRFQENPLPASLTDLSIPSFVELNEIIMTRPIFPEGMTKLAISRLPESSADLISKLPRSLLHLQLDSFDPKPGLWALPPHLEVIGNSVSANWIQNHSNELPSSLQRLAIFNDSRSIIPLLPRSLTNLDCRLDPLNSHLLPPTLTFLDIYIPEDPGFKTLAPFPETLTHIECGMAQYFPFTFLPRTNLTRLRLTCRPEEIKDLSCLSNIPACVQHLKLSLDAKLPNESLGQLPCMTNLTSLELTLDETIFSSECFAFLGPSLLNLSLELNHINPIDCPPFPRSLQRLTLRTHNGDEKPSREAYQALLQSLLPSNIGVVVLTPHPPREYYTWAKERRIYFK